MSQNESDGMSMATSAKEQFEHGAIVTEEDTCSFTKASPTDGTKEKSAVVRLKNPNTSMTKHMDQD